MLGTAINQPPLPGRNRSRKIRRRGVRLADGEVALVSPACATKSLRVGDAEIKSGTLIFAGVLKVDADPVDARRHREGDFEVGLVLLALDVAGEHQVCRRAVATC